MNIWLQIMIAITFLLTTVDEINEKAESYGSCSIPVMLRIFGYGAIIGMWLATECGLL